MNRWVKSSILLGAALCVMTSSASAERVTYSKDVAPIFQENCQGCHRPGQIAPMSLLTYQDARPWAKSIKKQVGSRKMPPYFAHPSSLPMKGDLNLSQDELDTIVAWVDQGAREGDPANLPEPLVFDSFEGGWTLKQPDLVLQPMEPFMVGKEVDDEYRCYRIPLGLDHDVWLKGVEFKPGNSKVVHHFILFEDVAGNFAARDDATPEPGCECKDMETMLAGTKLLKMWAPGNVQPLSPVGVGTRIGKGHDLILQIHYHNVTGADTVDLSSFALHLAQPDETIQKEIRMQLVLQPNLNILAGDPESKHEAKFTTRKDVTLYSSGVHMHYRGKDMGMWAWRPGELEEETILWVPNYDFNWQLTYEFEEPYKAPKGTQFIMRSTHDNSEGNPFNPDPTKDVHWGLATSDEMAFSGYSYTYDDEALNITPQLPEQSAASVESEQTDD
ncbi:MAG: c-type cytochrome [Candidatus Hydrogenedentes bacterium]|nr:c-type cytochrome [Candidatus Hydrogenedentota bacterium]